MCTTSVNIIKHPVEEPNSKPTHFKEQRMADNRRTFTTITIDSPSPYLKATAKLIHLNYDNDIDRPV
jgi:hypothetical protein